MSGIVVEQCLPPPSGINDAVERLPDPSRPRIITGLFEIKLGRPAKVLNDEICLRGQVRQDLLDDRLILVWDVLIWHRPVHGPFEIRNGLVDEPLEMTELYFPDHHDVAKQASTRRCLSAG